MDKEKAIIASWKVNAANWIDIIEQNGIESRKLVTNQAIIVAVSAFKPASVLDIGCGEGWLAKNLYDKGIKISGIDIIPALVDKAKEKVPGYFVVASYEDLYNHTIKFPHLFDAIVINFALIGKESTENLLASLPGYLTAEGKLFIQTLHPYSRQAMNDYTSGWKTGSWDGLGEQFTNSYEWYFRTMDDWMQLLKESGFNNIKVKEIFHPHSEKPLSVIFEADR